jgi:hypothetical protein
MPPVMSRKLLTEPASLSKSLLLAKRKISDLQSRTMTAMKDRLGSQGSLKAVFPSPVPGKG